MLAEGLGMSGIVSILFTGILMKRYTYSNLSRRSQKFVSSFFELISSVAETVIFIYMGLNIAMGKRRWSHAGFIFFSIIFIGVARAANIFSCVFLVNLARRPHKKIAPNHQKALWYSGLRGAMAFALALQSLHDLPGGNGQTIFTATTAIILLTVLLIGGSTSYMLGALKVVGDSNNIDNPLDYEEAMDFDEDNDVLVCSLDEDSSPGNIFKRSFKKLPNSAVSFTALDRNYLTPFFTSQSEDESEEAKLLSPTRSQKAGFH